MLGFSLPSRSPIFSLCPDHFLSFPQCPECLCCTSVRLLTHTHTHMYPHHPKILLHVCQLSRIAHTHQSHSECPVFVPRQAPNFPFRASEYPVLTFILFLLTTPPPFLCPTVLPPTTHPIPPALPPTHCLPVLAAHTQHDAICTRVGSARTT